MRVKNFWLALGFAGILAAQGVDSPNGVFQMEGNASSDGFVCFKPSTGTGNSITNPDLAQPVNGNCPAGFTKVVFTTTNDWSSLGSPQASTGYINDLTNSQSDTSFTGGGSKDIYDLSLWQWKGAKASQAKDDIAHAYAAAYTMPAGGPQAGHTIIVTGLDRYDNSGAATAGFWFLQDSTVKLNNVAGGGADGGFDGHHVDGDLLIVSDFSTGGAISNISVYKWVGNGTSGSLVFQEGVSSGNVTCNPTVGNLSFCGISNPETVPAIQATGYSFLDKSGSSQYLHGEFLEVAIDLNAVFPGGAPCFTTFIAETRASNAANSTLSDFTGPASFPLCGIKLSKSCGTAEVAANGSSITYRFTGTVTNTATGTLYDVDVTDTQPDGTSTTPATLRVVGPTTNVTCTSLNGSNINTCPTVLNGKDVLVFNLPDFVATTSNCKAGVTNCPNPLSATNSATVKAAPSEGGIQTIVYPDPNANPAQFPASATCTLSPSGKVSIEKHCDATNGGATLVAEGGIVKAKVFFTAKVCNAGTAGTDEALSNITLADNPTATLSSSSIASLAPGACQTVTGSYYPTTIDSSTGRYGFTDTIRVTGATGALGVPLTPVAGCPAGTDLACSPITCPICFDSVCTGQPQP